MTQERTTLGIGDPIREALQGTSHKYPMKEKKIRVKLVGDDAHTAYIALPGYREGPEFGRVSKTLILDALVPGYKGPRVHLDFNKDGTLIGIELLV